MNNRSEIVKKIRPNIEVDNEKSTEAEMFQSNTLRPILKLQNEVILSLFNNHLADNKYEVKNLTENKKKEHIHHTIKNNLQLKQLMLGTVIGIFTNDELAFYYLDKKEISKRIISMLIERICSQLQSVSF